MNITILAPAEVSFHSGVTKTRNQISAMLSGSRSKETCTDHLGGEFSDYGLDGGYIELIYDDDKQSYMVLTTYTAQRKMPDSLLDSLRARTVAQWSDGIGSDCFAEFEAAHSLSVNLYNSAKAVEVNVTEPKVDANSAHQHDVDSVDRVVPGRLCAAAADGDLEKVVQLLKSGAHLEELRQGVTPLCQAILSGHPEVAILLLENGADARFCSDTGEDPLYYCAVSNRMGDAGATQVARFLLDTGVDPN